MKVKREAAEKAERESGDTSSDKENASGGGDILGEQEDADVIF
jgi:hypothetical protein